MQHNSHQYIIYHWVNTSANKMMLFLGIHLAMGVQKRPYVKDEGIQLQEKIAEVVAANVLFLGGRGEQPNYLL